MSGSRLEFPRRVQVPRGIIFGVHKQATDAGEAAASSRNSLICGLNEPFRSKFLADY
jgi:hypothetical protein